MKFLIKYIATLCISMIAGMLLLFMVYTLPVQNMKANVARSSDIFNYEGVYPQLSNGYKYTQLDNYTDSIMLGAAIYDEPGDIVTKAVNNYHVDSEQLSSVLALTNYANNVSVYDYFSVPYGRYWHGYLVPLKFLLLFLDYSDIRILNFFLQNILLFMMIKLFCRNHLQQYIPAFLIMIFIINPMTTALSLQFSAVYYVSLLSGICLLHFAEKGKATEEKINYLFLITGVMTSYVDFLTYPFVSCGILLVIYLIINKGYKDVIGVKPLFQKLLLWGVGYGGMWGGKWLAGSILTQVNLFKDALDQALFRTSPDNVQGYGRMDAVIKNMSVFFKWPFLIAFLLGAGYFLFRLRKLTLRRLRQNMFVIFSFIAIAILPVVWIFIMANHSYEHYWFTYKEFAVSGFALVSLGIYMESLVCDRQT